MCSQPDRSVCWAICVDSESTVVQAPLNSTNSTETTMQIQLQTTETRCRTNFVMILALCLSKSFQMFPMPKSQRWWSSLWPDSINRHVHGSLAPNWLSDWRCSCSNCHNRRWIDREFWRILRRRKWGKRRARQAVKMRSNHWRMMRTCYDPLSLAPTTLLRRINCTAKCWMREIRGNSSTEIGWHECCANEKSVGINEREKKSIYEFIFIGIVWVLCHVQVNTNARALKYLQNAIDSSAFLSAAQGVVYFKVTTASLNRVRQWKKFAGRAFEKYEIK